MFDEFIYGLCDKIVTICESIQSRIKTKNQKDWLNGYNKWKSRINKNDTE